MEQAHKIIVDQIDSELRRKANWHLAGAALAVAILAGHATLAFDIVDFGDTERSVTGYAANYLGMAAATLAIVSLLYRYTSISQSRKKLREQS